MPYVRRRKYTYRRPIRRTRKISTLSSRRLRKTARRRSNRVRKVLSLRPKWENPIPNASFIRFVYTDDGFGTTLNSGNSYRYRYVFRGNSVYDPDYTGVGVQPYGYDEWTAIYPSGSYRVTASSISVHCTIVTANVQEVRVFVYPTRQSGALSYDDINDLRRFPKCRWHVVNSVNGQTRQNWIHNYCTTNYLYKFTNTNQDAYSASVSSSPGTSWFWHVLLDGGVTGAEILAYFDVKIVYYTRISRSQSVNES